MSLKKDLEDSEHKTPLLQFFEKKCTFEILGYYEITSHIIRRQKSTVHVIVLLQGLKSLSLLFSKLYCITKIEPLATSCLCSTIMPASNGRHFWLKGLSWTAQCKVRFFKHTICNLDKKFKIKNTFNTLLKVCWKFFKFELFLQVKLRCTNTFLVSTTQKNTWNLNWHSPLKVWYKNVYHEIIITCRQGTAKARMDRNF